MRSPCIACTPSCIGSSAALLAMPGPIASAHELQQACAFQALRRRAAQPQHVGTPVVPLQIMDWFDMRGICEAFTTVDYVGISAYVPQVRCCWRSSSSSLLLKRICWMALSCLMPCRLNSTCTRATWQTTWLVMMQHARRHMPASARLGPHYDAGACGLPALRHGEPHEDGELASVCNIAA